jgi:hypothetical protein
LDSSLLGKLNPIIGTVLVSSFWAVTVQNCLLSTPEASTSVGFASNIFQLRINTHLYTQKLTLPSLQPLYFTYLGKDGESILFLFFL